VRDDGLAEQEIEILPSLGHHLRGATGLQGGCRHVQAFRIGASGLALSILEFNSHRYAKTGDF
jgi:hypothetical protein